MSISKTDIEWRHWIGFVAGMGYLYAHLAIGPKTTPEAWGYWVGFGAGYSAVLGLLAVLIFGFVRLLQVRGRSARILAMLILIVIFSALIMDGVTHHRFLGAPASATN